MAPKIVHLSSVRNSSDIRVFQRECRSLARAGYGVTLVVPAHKDTVIDGVAIRAVPVPGNRLIRMTLTTRRVYRQALREAADVYHFHDPELIPAGLALRALGKKVIYGIHEDAPKDILTKHYIPAPARPLVAWFCKQLENRAAPYFSALMTATDAIAERFRSFHERTVVVHNYPRPSELTPSTTPWNKRESAVAYLGSISRKRGISELVQAMGMLGSNNQHRLKLAGHFAPPALREEIRTQPGWDRVDELGYLAPSAVADTLSQVCAGIVVYHPEPNHVRAEPFKLYEYMAAGIPVIASDFRQWRSIIEKAGCGIAVNPLSPGAIAGAVEYILAHPAEAEAMGRRGRRAAETYFNWENEERTQLNLYATLLQESYPSSERKSLYHFTEAKSR